ncbi:6072_t:CDS:10 [Entrophospora sp. SA101]|nr:6072_t:CDS:10 [Entrophospora sp. SA101]
MNDSNNTSKDEEETTIKIIEKIEETSIEIDNVNNKRDQLEVVVTENNPEEKKGNDFSKKLHINGQKILVVSSEDEVLSGETAPNCCVLGSPDHVAALKAKIDELKLNSGNLLQEKQKIEQERLEAEARSESIAQQLDKLVDELKKLGHHGNDDKNSEQLIHATVHTFGKIRKLEIIADEEEESHIYDRLWRKPRVRQYWHDGTLHREAEERKSSYTELFWDLIFVAVVNNLGHLLVSDISFSNLESSEDLLEKFLLLWEMSLVIVMGTHAMDIYNDTKIIFLSSYVFARMTFLCMYILLATWLPLFRRSLITFAWGILIPTLFWLVAIFVPASNTKDLMWTAISFELLWSLVIPLYNRYGIKRHPHNSDFKKVDSVASTIHENSINEKRPIVPHQAMKTRGTEYQWKWKDVFLFSQPPVYKTALNIEHWSERLGTFTIICLGEGMFGILYTGINSYPDGQLGKALLGLLISYNLHWIYFDVDASRQYLHALRRHVFTGVLFGMVHFPLNMSLIAFGSSLGKIVMFMDFNGAQDIPMPPSYEDHLLSYEISPSPATETTTTEHSFPIQQQWLLCGSLALAFYCLAFIGCLHKGLDTVSCTRIPKRVRIGFRCIVGTIFVFLPLAHLDTLNLTFTLAMLSFAQVMLETYGRLRPNTPLFGKCDNDIIGDMYEDEKKSSRRYVRWRWGPEMNIERQRSLVEWKL